MQFQSVESNKGGKIAVMDGYSYNQKQSTINFICWCCVKSFKFPAIPKTQTEIVIEMKETFSHDCHPSECKVEKVRQNKRSRCSAQLLRLPMNF